LTYTISGKPTSAGIATFPINIFDKSCVIELNVSEPQIASLNCSQMTNTGVLPNLGAEYREFVSVSYSGGNGRVYSSEETIASTGVEGLTLQLGSNTLALGDGSLNYSITGTPTTSGIASFALNFGGQSCVLNVTVNGSPISSLNCAQSIVLPGILKSGIVYTGTTSVSYAGGNGIPYFEGSGIPSTGVTGLMATLAEGKLVNGDGSLKYIITGTPVGYGTAVFAISFGGKNCELNLNVLPQDAAITTLECINAIYLPTTIFKGFPYSGTLDINYIGGNGGIYAGQEILSSGVTGLKAKLDASFVSNTNGSIQYSITGTPVSSGDAIFAVNFGGQICTIKLPVAIPTITSLNCTNAISANAIANVGIPFQTIATVNYANGNGSNFASQEVLSTGVLGLTAKLNAGTLVNGDGSLSYTIYGKALSEGTAKFDINFAGQICSFSIVVSPSSITSIVCPTLSTTTFKAHIQNSLTITVPYTGGNSMEYATDIIQSTGVTGLNAVLNAGVLSNGSGSLSYTITGKPGSAGTASFAINFGGQNCSFSIQVESLKIGDSWGGGVVGYIDELNGHGIIVGPTQIGNYSYSQANEACNNYISGIYDDWELPTIGQLNLLYAPYLSKLNPLLELWAKNVFDNQRNRYNYYAISQDGSINQTQAYGTNSYFPIRVF
jgi:hypothetical protein